MWGTVVKSFMRCRILLTVLRLKALGSGPVEANQEGHNG